MRGDVIDAGPAQTPRHVAAHAAESDDGDLHGCSSRWFRFG